MSCQWSSSQLICGDHEHTLPVGIGYINHPKISAGLSLSQSHTRPFPPFAVFAGPAEDFCDFLLSDSMTISMRYSRFRVKIEANFH